ncbi:MAG: TlpA disulfide reductase family protein [Pseudomonadota bacterium]|nr:TlpA disulfide reductase family protein [Pseudomonadota bacterium]
MACLALLLGVFDPAAAGETTFADLARAAGMEAYAVPLKAPNFELRGLAGETRSKRDYRGRVVLLNFWASWCPPCREEFPSLERLQQALGGRDFTVLAIAVADSETAVGRFLEGRRPAFDVLLDDERKTAADYRSPGVPVTYLLDRQGRLLAGKTGPRQWDGPEMQALIRAAIRAGQ